MTKHSSLTLAKGLSLSIQIIWMAGLSGNLFASNTIQGNPDVMNGDTLKIDERIETPQMYVYHEMDQGEPVFQRFDGGKHMILKWVKNNLPFNGVLLLLNDDGKQISPYINGIPDGLWMKYAQNGNLEYEVPIKGGFYNGECKFYYTEEQGEISRIGTFSNGYPDGLFVVNSQYGNTGERFEAERLTLRTIFNRASEANRSYLSSDSDGREAVSGVYISNIYHLNYLPALEPNNDNYWLDNTGCLNYALNPLPPAQTILEGEYIKKDIFIGDGSLSSDSSFVKISNKIFWRNGRCLWAEEYKETPYNSSTVLPKYSLTRRSEYEYFSGYFVEKRTTLNLINTDFSADNIYYHTIEAKDLIFFDTLVTTPNTYINGQLKHGRVSEFATENSPSISGPEGKFSVNFNYSEGEYFLNTKVGEWKYYIVTNEEKRLVCVTNYHKFSNLDFSGFTLKQSFKGFCNISYLEEGEVKHGTEKFYRLKDAAFYVGYNYKNGTAISTIKE